MVDKRDEAETGDIPAGMLALDAQLCFAVYSAAHALNRTYMPLLDHWPDRPPPFTPERSQVLVYIADGDGCDLRGAAKISCAAKTAQVRLDLHVQGRYGQHFLTGKQVA